MSTCEKGILTFEVHVHAIYYIDITAHSWLFYLYIISLISSYVKKTMEGYVWYFIVNGSTICHGRKIAKYTVIQTDWLD